MPDRRLQQKVLPYGECSILTTYIGRSRRRCRDRAVWGVKDPLDKGKEKGAVCAVRRAADPRQGGRRTNCHHAPMAMPGGDGGFGGASRAAAAAPRASRAPSDLSLTRGAAPNAARFIGCQVTETRCMPGSGVAAAKGALRCRSCMGCALMAWPVGPSSRPVAVMIPNASRARRYAFPRRCFRARRSAREMWPDW